MSEKKADDLALLAHLYAGGELPAPEAALFEQRLSQDQAARDALAEAVWMSAVLYGGEPRPDPAYRQQVRDRLRPTWWRRLVGRRSYRGHPAFWSALGAVAAALCLLLLRPAPAVQVVERTVVQTQPEPEAEDDAAALHDMALVWAELHNPDHAVKSATQEQKRKDRREDRRQLRKTNSSEQSH